MSTPITEDRRLAIIAAADFKCTRDDPQWAVAAFNAMTDGEQNSYNKAFISAKHGGYAKIIRESLLNVNG